MDHEPESKAQRMNVEDKINILVVDDVPEKLLSMRAILEELGENIITAQSGRDALRHLLHQDFAVILLDVNMPDIDGFETAMLIRQRKRSEHTPIIFVTAFSDETHAWQGYSLGAVDYILAPVIPEVLRAKVSVFVDLFRKNEQIKQQAEQRIAFAKEQAARAAAEAATQRSMFLAEASNALARSLDYEATIDCFLRLVVPRFADLVAVTMLNEWQDYPPTELVWAEPHRGNLRSSVREQGQLPPTMTAAIETAIRHESLQHLGPLRFAPATAEGANGEATAEIEIQSGLVIPLLARNRTLGALSLCRRPGSPAFHLPEVMLAEDLAGRAAVAIDNARLYREIQEGDRRKDEFLAMLSHELRNPLGAISNALECLARSREDQASWDTVYNILRRQSQQITRLVDDLLDVSRITRGKVELRKEPLDLATAIERAVASTSSIVSSRQHHLSVVLPPTPVRLLADPTRLEQVLANLINNAAKYTNPGGRIRLSAEVEQDWVSIHVQDNGMGISAALRPQVFDLFVQGERSLDRSQGGLGIGLTLVRSLVHLHGGSVEVSSQGTDQGSEFVVRLPLHVPVEPSTPLPVAATGDVARSELLPLRILVVDDNPDITTTMAALLRKVGHEVNVANDGMTALETARFWQPDAVLVDIGLPGMSGYEVAQRLRQEPGGSRQLLLAMTGYGQQEDIRRSTEAGFDHHLTKPVEYGALESVLSAHAALLASSMTRAP